MKRVYMVWNGSTEIAYRVMTRTAYDDRKGYEREWGKNWTQVIAHDEHEAFEKFEEACV